MDEYKEDRNSEKCLQNGGKKGPNYFFDSTEWYNEKTDSWTNGPKLLQKRGNFGVATVKVKKPLNI